MCSSCVISLLSRPRLSADLYPRDICIFIPLYYLVAGYLCTGIALCSLSSCARLLQLLDFWIPTYQTPLHEPRLSWKERHPSPFKQLLLPLHSHLLLYPPLTTFPATFLARHEPLCLPHCLHCLGVRTDDRYAVSAMNLITQRVILTCNS